MGWGRPPLPDYLPGIMRTVNECDRFTAQGYEVNSRYKDEIIDPRQHEEEG